MSPRTSRRFLGSEDVPRLPSRKRPGNWLTPTTSAGRCAGTSSSIQVALPGSALVKHDRGADTESICKRRKYARLVVGVDEEEQQVTQDLCASFLNVESTEFGSVVPWRSTSNSPNGMDTQQSGTTSEEDQTTHDAIDNDSAATVRSAAELLTKLICERNAGSNDGHILQEPGGPHSKDPQRQLLDEPIRWGVRKKVSYESRRSVDPCDLGICTGLIRKLSHDQEKPAAITPAPNTSHSPIASWDPSSPNLPASSDLHKDRRSSGDGGASSVSQSPELSFQGSRSERQKKILLMSPTCPGNILKLPKEMQGRWSSERYKIAQLKLIEIMHERKTAPGRPILRPALREEARKHIGDTGLLDHLLKHMTDTVVHTGERFRRRHNSEGAMEYWLEHASLMELRKSAGVEDPSWIPPAGWKVGDTLSDRNWQLPRGMTSAEAAEMQKLKETVERLKSEMKVLCGSITASNQRGVLPSLRISNDDRLDFPERAEEEGNPSQGRIRVEMSQFKSDMSVEQPSHQELKSGANIGIRMERFQNLESAVAKAYEDRKPLKEIDSPSGNQDDLESQLQDVRKTVAMMQADVSHVISILGIVPPIKAKPMRYELGPGNALPLVLSAGDETASITQRSLESQPSDTSKPVIQDFVILKQDAPMRQCSNPGRTSINGGYMVGHSARYTDGLSQALSNYNLVNQPDPLSAHSNEKMKYSESTTEKHDGGPPVTILSRPQNFKPLFTNQPTGFTIFRPPGSFLWPSMLNVTQVLPTNNTSMSRREQSVDLRVLEGGTGDVSSGTPMSLPMAPVNYSLRSIAESKVAATMATMFGCMAMAPPYSLPTLPLMTSEVDTSRSNLGQCSFLGAEQSNPALSLSLSLSVSPQGISQ